MASEALQAYVDAWFSVFGHWTPFVAVSGVIIGFSMILLALAIKRRLPPA